MIHDSYFSTSTPPNLGSSFNRSIERADGGRGFGFTGGHFPDNWANDNFRKVVLNAFLWSAHVEVPVNGVESKVSAEELEANLDPKKK